MSTLGRTSVMEKSKDTIEVTRLKARLRWLLKERESHEKEIKELKDKLKKCNCGRASLKKHKRRKSSKRRRKSSKRRRRSSKRRRRSSKRRRRSSKRRR